MTDPRHQQFILELVASCYDAGSQRRRASLFVAVHRAPLAGTTPPAFRSRAVWRVRRHGRLVPISEALTRQAGLSHVARRNVAVALLLLHLLEDAVGLTPQAAATASLFFVLPSPATTAQLLEANGGSVETFLYVLLLWLTRARPVWCGLVLGVGILQRAFTVYGYVSLVLVLAARRKLFTRIAARRSVVTLLVASALWWTAETAKQAASSHTSTFVDHDCQMDTRSSWRHA